MTSQREAPAGGDTSGGARFVGALLRERRERRGLTPEQVGLALRYKTRHINALEEGRFGDLPPQPYARGLLGAYAALVGLDPEQMIIVCGQDFPGSGVGKRTSVFRYPDRERFVWREWTVPIALAAAAAALAIARFTLLQAPVELDAPTTVPAQQQRIAQQTAPAAEPEAPPTATPPVMEADPGVRVVLRCEGTTWVESAPDGAEPRRYDLGPGQNLELTARERLTLSMADAGVIRLAVNGRELGFIGHKGEKKTGLSFVAPKVAPATAAGAASGD